MTHFAVPTVNLIVIRNNEILLSRRANTGWMDDHLIIPGGHVESSETPTIAVLREAKEELGVSITAGSIDFVCIAVRYKEVEEHMAFVFKIDGSKLDVINTEPKKCSEFVWAKLTDLPLDIIPDFRQIIEKGLIESNTYVEIGWPKTTQ